MSPHGGAKRVPDLDRLRFPADPWRLVETEYDRNDLGTTETLFAVGNGYLGFRGNVEEGRDTYEHGTFINGFHETWDIKHAEEAYGFARTGQTIANVPDTKVIRLYVDDEPLLLSKAELVEYERSLDMRSGVLTRELLWRTPGGNRVKVTSRRMVSFVHRHLGIMTFDVTLLDRDAPVAISSQMLNRGAGIDEYRATPPGSRKADPRKALSFTERVLEPRYQRGDDSRVTLGYRAINSGMTLAVSMEHMLTGAQEFDQQTEIDGDYAKHVFRTHAQAGQTVSLTKLVSYHSSSQVPARELADRCHRTLDRARDEGIERQFREQSEWLDAFWERSDVEVGSDDATQQAVRFNLFHLAQAAARAERNGIPAKGVTAAGYDGHYFWDTEIYVVPFFVYTSPHIARNALRFRYTMLPAARQRAAELAQRGALFPWRTINGEEASAYYAAGTAQYHIDADIAYAVSKYVKATGDEEFLAREGIDILVETARMWADLGFWRGDGPDKSFRIHGVTGPDEYTTVVNDNVYTNVMARYNLRAAVRGVENLERRWPEEYARMVARLGLEEHEIEEWSSAADHMAVLWDETLGIHPQDALFDQRELWDLENTPAEKRPLLLHFHPLVIYRFQVLKQADVVMALFLQGNEFSDEEKRADFDYYDPITTGDSTLSAVVQSIIAAEVGYHELAYDYFLAGLFVDLANLHHNTSDGMHIASTGGVWAALVNGFAGMREYDGVVQFDPRLPAAWDHMTFKITVRHTRLRVTLRHESIEFQVEEGGGVSLEVRGERVTVSGEGAVTVPLDGQGPRIAGAPDPHAFHGTVRDDGTVMTASIPSMIDDEEIPT